MGNSGFLVSDCSPLLCYNHAKTTTFSTQSFTGKERDSETGLSYFGARYYDSDLMTGWLSVDPMADKYPSLSPYNYCAWNPVKLVDPDGEEISPIFSTEGKFLGTDDEGYGGRTIIMEENSFREGMTHEEAQNNGTFLDEYGSSIFISDSDWDKIETNGGTKQKPYLSNKTNERIFFKPDKTMNVFSEHSAYPCEPHSDIYMPIDGIKIANMKSNEVLKVTDGTRVIVEPVYECISRTHTCKPINIRFQNTPKSFCGNILKGGFVNAPDAGWYALRDAFIKF